MISLESWGSLTARELDGAELERRTLFMMNNLAQHLGLLGQKMLIICQELLVMNGLVMLSHILILVVCSAF